MNHPLEQFHDVAVTPPRPSTYPGGVHSSRIQNIQYRRMRLSALFHRSLDHSIFPNARAAESSQSRQLKTKDVQHGVPAELPVLLLYSNDLSIYLGRYSNMVSAKYLAVNIWQYMDEVSVSRFI